MVNKKETSNVNIKEIKALSDSGNIASLLSKIKDAKKSVGDISAKLRVAEQDLKAKRQAQKQAELADNEKTVEEVKVEAPVKAEVAQKEVAPKAEAPKKQPKTEKVSEKVEEVKVEKEPEIETKVEETVVEDAPKRRETLSERLQKMQVAKPQGQKKSYTPQEDRRPRSGDRTTQNGKQNQAGGQKVQGKPAQRGAQPIDSVQAKSFGKPSKPQEVYIPKDNNKAYASKKKQNEKNNYEDRHATSKKQLARGNVSIDDFDEDKSGYRKVRSKKSQKTQEETRIKIEKATINKEIIPIKELSEKIGISAVEISKMLFKEGIIKTINDSIDYDTAGFIAAEIGVELELKLDKTAEDVLSEGFNEAADDMSLYVTRPPVVTVMGHVDHGKTSLLDRIRSTNVTAGEAGGITQHIGAYSVSVKGNKITFLDTPGHAAFTSMRARGAQVTDIAVIVIAADDGIMPQTIEAINHAKAANVSIIVAANKIDKHTANIDRVKQQLAEHDVLIEEWGGDVMLVPVSAKTGLGVDDLLDSILLIAEMRELKANPNRKAKGAVVEAKLDKGKGPVATIIVQNGTLKAGDNIVAGTIVGKVRAMFDDKGRMVKEAGPSMAVSVLGLESVPNAGDIIFAVEQEKLTKLVAEERKNKEREEMIRQQQKVSLDDLFSKISVGDLKVLNIIIKADVQGSVEAVKQSLEELSNENVKVSVIHSGVGAINETDIMLADSSNSIVIGFNVRPDANAKQLAERSKIDVKLYRIIYEAIEDIQKAMKGMLEPKFKDVYMGKAEVRETFKITGVGMVAGSYVTEGKIVRNGKLRIYRDDVMICEGNVLQLKRFKDDVKEVNQGFECGISIENFNDIKVGDFIESYVIEEDK